MKLQILATDTVKRVGLFRRKRTYRTYNMLLTDERGKALVDCDLKTLCMGGFFSNGRNLFTLEFCVHGDKLVVLP